MSSDYRLVTAVDLERMGVLRKGTAYRMAKVGAIPSYAVGATKGRGVRFKIEEVLAALRRPAFSETETAHSAHPKKGVAE